MSQLVKLESIAGNNVNATTSLKIAEFTGLLHKNVLQSIENLIPSGKFNELNFQPVDYKDKKGEKRKSYILDEKFTSILLMGMTGEKALDWKIAYTEAFQEMRSELSKPKTASLTTGDVFKDFHSIAEVLGLKAEQAAIHANHATRKKTGDDVLALMEIKFEVEAKTMCISDILQGTGISGRKGNQILLDEGFIAKDVAGNWALTPKGIGAGGKIVSQEGGGKMRQSIEWPTSIREEILGA
jgi:Rha family phage regulatory protein